MSCQGIGIWFGTANCPQDGKMKVQELLVGTCLVTHPMMAARVGRLSALLMIQHFVQSWRAFVMCIHGWHVMCTGTSCSVWILLVSCLHAMLIKARKCCASGLLAASALLRTLSNMATIPQKPAHSHKPLVPSWFTLFLHTKPSRSLSKETLLTCAVRVNKFAILKSVTTEATFDCVL